MTGNYHRISPTSALCAVIRGKLGMPYAKDVVDALMARDPDCLGDLKGVAQTYDPQTATPESKARAMILEGRHVATNIGLDYLGKTRPILEIAAGTSTRSLSILADDPSRVYIETMLPGELEMKRYVLEEVRKKHGLPEPENHMLVPLDLLDYGTMEDAGMVTMLDSRQPASIAFNGLLMYLSAEEKSAAFDNFRLFLSEFSPHGMIVTTDMAFRMSVVEKTQKAQKAIEDVKKQTGRDLHAFGSDAEALEFLADHGFTASFLEVDSFIGSLVTPKQHAMDDGLVRMVAHTYRPMMIGLRDN